jgi:hypothetical protein
MKTLRTRRMGMSGIVTGLALASMACEKPAPPAAQAAAAPAPNVVTVTARDFAFDAPDEIPAGQVTFRFRNDGPNLHHLQLVHLGEGKTVADLQQAMRTPGPLPSWAQLAGGPNAPMPGKETNETTVLAAGNYAMICFIDLPDHVPHVMKGMARALRVVEPAQAVAAAPLTTADLTITLSDYKFDLSDSLRAGTHSIDVLVSAGQPHELVIFRLKPGQTVDSLMQWGATYKGELPATVLGGTTAATAGVPQRITVNFEPGQYVFVCFLPDAADGKPHLMKGMVRTLTVS